MYQITDTKTGNIEMYDNPTLALIVSMGLNGIGNETIRGAIVTALHWIEQVDEPQ